MIFASAIPPLDMNVIACVLVALGIVTIWYGRSIVVPTSSGANGPAANWRFDPLADLGHSVASRVADMRALFADVWQSLRSSIASVAERGVKASSITRSRSVAVAPVLAPVERLSLDDQVEALQSRIVGHVDAMHASERLHLAASRQLDAADYALERLRAEVDLISIARRNSAEPAVRPLPRITMPRRVVRPIAEAA